MKIKDSLRARNIRFIFLGVILVGLATSAWGQPSPAMRAVISADAPPEALSHWFTELGEGERVISVPGAEWLQIQFAHVDLGPEGALTISDASGESQTFSQEQIDSWRGLTATFNGSRLRVELKPGQGATEPVSARFANIIVGLPTSTLGDTEALTSHPLQDVLDRDIRDYIPEEVHESLAEAGTERVGGVESVCGTVDNRIASTDRRVGRVMPIGCTAWLIRGGKLLTAGHCIEASFQVVQFNVPASKADGTTVAPPVSDQYRVIADSIVSQDTGVGNDWAVFRVLPNTKTGLMPDAAQGSSFQLSNSQNPAQVRITGYGVDGPAPGFGGGRTPRNAQNQTEQTDVGTLSGNTGGANSGVLNYNADTQPGNSGSPVIVEGQNVTIGIHTNGGCSAVGGSNAGTSFRNASLWAAVRQQGWRVSYGGVSSWEDLATSRTTVDQLKLGDFNGDGKADVFSASNGQWLVSYGGESNWQNLATSQVSFDQLRLADFDGDGKTDVFTAWGGQWRVSYGGTSSWQNLATSVTTVDQLQLGDFNGDGKADVFSASNGQWRVSYGGTSTWQNLATSQVTIDQLELGDFNGDGKTDVFTSGNDQWRVSYGGTSNWQNLATSKVSFDQLRLGDFNGDGKADVFTAWGGRWRVSYGGTSSWQNLATSKVTVEGLRLGDFNGDGKSDVFAAW